MLLPNIKLIILNIFVLKFYLDVLSYENKKVINVKRVLAFFKTITLVNSNGICVETSLCYCIGKGVYLELLLYFDSYSIKIYILLPRLILLNKYFKH